MRSGRWSVVIGGLLALTACASPVTSPSSPTPTEAEGSTTLCTPVELRGPDGTRVDLNGTWEAAGEVWLVTHSGSCLTVEGLSALGGESVGASYRFVISGDVRPDFTVEGLRTWTWACSGPECPVQGDTASVVLHIEFDAEGQAIIEVSTWANEGSLTSTFTRTSARTEWPDQ